MTRMNPEIKKQWVAALRSKKYTQGKGCLRDELGHYCCLGVLTQLAVDAMSTGQAPTCLAPYLQSFMDPASTQWCRGLPPEEVVHWAGLLSQGPDNNPYTVRPIGVELRGGEESNPSSYFNLHSTLYELNDTGRYNFDQIADLIEEQF